MGDSLEQQLFSAFAANKTSTQHRLKVLRILKRTIHKALSDLVVQVEEYGSLPLKTYLPQGDIDVTIITYPLPVPGFELYLLQRVKLQFEFLASIKPDYKIQDIQEIHAKIPLVKCSVMGISTDITVNQVGGVRTLCFLEQVNRLLPEHVYKRSIILAKIWGCYYSKVLGSMHGRLTTVALEILVLYTLNTFSETRKDPFKVVEKLIEHFAEFDWENKVVTCCGALSACRYSLCLGLGEAPEQTAAKAHSQLFLSPQLLNKYRSDLGQSEAALMPHSKFVNIADPFNSTNNLGRSVSFFEFQSIKRAFELSYEHLQSKGIKQMFKNLLGDTEHPEEFQESFLFVNLKTRKSRLYRALAILDPSYPQNYEPKRYRKV